ncbi:MAG: hypothetical protein IJT65_01275 [Eubacterium sp.]|nr:hypothetical protein [Eubacterium sp.]
MPISRTSQSSGISNANTNVGISGLVVSSSVKLVAGSVVD